MRHIVGPVVYRRPDPPHPPCFEGEPALRRVELTGVPRLTGVQWTRGRIADTVFRDCRVDLATFAV